MMERAVLFGGTNPITQTNGRSPALTWDFYGQSRVWHVMGVLLCNTTVLLLWWTIRWESWLKMGMIFTQHKHRASRYRHDKSGPSLSRKYQMWSWLAAKRTGNACLSAVANLELAPQNSTFKNLSFSLPRLTIIDEYFPSSLVPFQSTCIKIDSATSTAMRQHMHTG